MYDHTTVETVCYIRRLFLPNLLNFICSCKVQEILQRYRMKIKFLHCYFSVLYISLIQKTGRQLSGSSLPNTTPIWQDVPSFSFGYEVLYTLFLFPNFTPSQTINCLTLSTVVLYLLSLSDPNSSSLIVRLPEILVSIPRLNKGVLGSITKNFSVTATESRLLPVSQ